MTGGRVNAVIKTDRDRENWWPITEQPWRSKYFNSIHDLKNKI